MKRLAVVLAVGLLLVLSGVALASIPGPDGVINGCRKNSDGSLKVIDSAATCGNGYTALNWNQTGPQGPAGISGYETIVVSAPFAQVAQDLWSTGPVTVACPSGKKVLGGGMNIINRPRAWTNRSYPESTGGIAWNSWVAEAASPTDPGADAVVYAICANVT